MYRKYKLCLALGFLGALTSTFNVYAQDDPCNKLQGTWKGTWISESSVIEDIRCHYDASILAEKVNSKAILQITLTNSNHRHLCKPKIYTVTGFCVEGKLILNDYLLEGEIIGSLMSLSGTHSYVRGSFTKA